MHEETIYMDAEKTREMLIAELADARETIDRMREYGNLVNKGSDFLRTGEQILRTFIEDMPASIAMFDQNMCYLTSSKRWCSVFGLEGISLAQKSYYELFPNTSKTWREIHDKCLGGMTLRREEELFIRPDGKQEWIKWEIRPWFNDQQQIGGLILMTESVTEQRNLRAEIERSRNELRKTNAYQESVLAAASEVGIIVTNEQGIIRLYNSGAYKMLGYEEWEVIDQLLPSDFREQEELRLHTEALMDRYHGSPLEARIRKLKREGVERGEWTMIRKNGTSFIASVTISPLYDEHGEIIGSVGVFLDITGEKAAQRELRDMNNHLEQMVSFRTQDLRRANEEIKNFAYIVSHDLRVPLVNIKGFSGELEQAIKEISRLCREGDAMLSVEMKQQMTYFLQEDIPESLHFINNSASRMDAMLNSVLQLSRMGRRKLEFRALDTGTLVQEILKSSRYPIEEKQVQIQVGHMPEVVADRTAMEQIFSNLINNAIVYLRQEEQGVIEVWGEATEEFTTYYVRDNGRGIEEKDISRIFNIFSRAGKNDVKGEGMGLSYVRMLVRRHGGEISCDSTPGVGSTFAFTISHLIVEESLEGM